MSSADRDGQISPDGEWSVDPSRSSVTFALKHMLMATVRGSFDDFEGTLAIASGTGQAEGRVRAASVETGDSVRDEHLRSSPDFFDVERYPYIEFSSTRIEQLPDGSLRIVGALSMRGTTHEIELSARLEKRAREDAAGERMTLELHGELDRRDFGLSWNQGLDAGGVLLGNKVKVALSISAISSEAALAVPPAP
jgi:polyisoprenoid-binding protein YceI